MTSRPLFLDCKLQLSAILTVLSILTACGPASDQDSSPSDYSYIDAGLINLGGVMEVYLGSGFISRSSSSRGLKYRERLLFGAIGSILSVGGADLILVTDFNTRIEDVVFIVKDKLGNVIASYNAPETKLELKRLKGKFATQTIDDAYKDNQVQDQRLTIFLQSAGVGNDELKEVVSQILAVMRFKDTPTRSELAKAGVTHPIAIDLNKVVNGIKTERKPIDGKDKENRIRYVVSAQAASSFATCASSPKKLWQASSGWALAAAALSLGSYSALEIHETNFVIDFRDAANKTYLILSGDELRLLLLKARPQLKGAEVNDLIDENGILADKDGIVAQFFLHLNEQGSDATRKRELVRQLLEVIHASPKDTIDDLRERRVTDERLLELARVQKELIN